MLGTVAQKMNWVHSAKNWVHYFCTILGSMETNFFIRAKCSNRAFASALRSISLSI